MAAHPVAAQSRSVLLENKLKSQFYERDTGAAGAIDER